MSKIKIIKKLKKLMIHERSARLIGNEDEADRYAELIAKLREKHKITQEIPLDDEAGASAFSQYGGEPVFTPSDPLFRRKRIFWEENLFYSICQFFKCRAIVFKNSNLKVVVGEPAEREKVKRSYLHLYRTATDEAAELLKVHFNGGTSEENRLRKQSFYHGFSYALGARFDICRAAEEEIEKIEKETGLVPVSRSGTALVKKDSIEVQEEKRQINDEIDNLNKMKKPTISKIDEQAFQAGMYVGGNCSVNEEVALPAQKTIEDLRNVQKQVETRTAKLFWAENFVKRGNWRYGSSNGSTSTFSGDQRTFVFDENDR